MDDENAELSYAGKVGAAIHRVMVKSRYRTIGWQCCFKAKVLYKVSFTFLSYSFRPCSKPSTFKRHNKFMIFHPAICEKAMTFIRERIRSVFNPRNTQVSLEIVAVRMNPKIRGWLNY